MASEPRESVGVSSRIAKEDPDDREESPGYVAYDPLTGRLQVDVAGGNLPDESGTWGYAAGVSGSVTLAGSKRVLQITAIAKGTGGTITINGGATITIPADSSIAILPRGNLVDPSLTFTDTDAYFVEHLT